MSKIYSEKEEKEIELLNKIGFYVKCSMLALVMVVTYVKYIKP